MAKHPNDCATMDAIRAEIDALDDTLIEVLAHRADYIDRAIALKQDLGLPARIDERVEQVAANARRNAARTGLDQDLAERLVRQLVEWSIAREETALGATSEPEEV